jgi:hypothetical protein
MVFAVMLVCDSKTQVREISQNKQTIYIRVRWKPVDPFGVDFTAVLLW